jgi:hypothetical protein
MSLLQSRRLLSGVAELGAFALMTDTEAKVVAAWKMAAADLGIRFTSPFVVTTADGGSHEHLGLVHQFGGRIGALISVLHEPSQKIPRPAGDDYHWSILNPHYGRYERQAFIGALDDLGFFGSEAERPSWYTGKYWGQQ